MNEALLYETIMEHVGQNAGEAWRLYSALALECDISAPLSDYVARLGGILGVPIYTINSTWERLKHSFEAYPFAYTIIKEGNPRFPGAVEGIHFLYAYGDLSLLDANPVTVLGMRGPGEEARSQAVAVMKDLIDLERPILSTLDTGLDAYSMLYALNNRMGQIAVLASPLHQCMPESQKDLMVGIANSGRSLLISPFAPSSRAQKWFTVPRNKLLVAMSSTMVILEEKDGGPLWRLASSHLEKGRKLIIASNCTQNPSYSYAQNYAERQNVAIYHRRGDLKRLLGEKKSRSRASSDDGQLELF